LVEGLKVSGVGFRGHTEVLSVLAAWMDGSGWIGLATTNSAGDCHRAICCAVSLLGHAVRWLDGLSGREISSYGIGRDK
jgi:hypothetical protein